MRMWMIDPKYLCDKHLLGEHVELHMLKGSVDKKKNLGKLLTDGFVDPSRAEERHEIVSSEMIRRRMNHKSPLEMKSEVKGCIDTERNRKDLINRCVKCCERVEK